MSNSDVCCSIARLQAETSGSNKEFKNLSILYQAGGYIAAAIELMRPSQAASSASPPIH